MKQTITKSSVDAMPIGTVAVDTKIDGFVARKLPSGKVSYGFRYRDHTRTQRWLSLGVHGQSGTTAETARAKAKVLQGKVAAGHDPAAEQQAARDKAEKAKACGKEYRERGVGPVHCPSRQEPPKREDRGTLP